ncbi:hypothetical protein GGR54DRAFT_200223 [Hypoxylon sp. NC1633]|nr:hypothetical protein GGR54DRAFT_200223 [Hypoxylon sp. NC1633]
MSSNSEFGTDLPKTTKTYLTGHDAEGKSIVKQSHSASWDPIDGGKMGFNQIYTNNFMADMNDDADIKFNDETNAGGKLGLVSRGGAVCRMVDFSPSYECIYHRTKSMDYGICLKGPMELVLDDGSVTRLQTGDVVVQRATMHAWRNPSTDSWARMIYVLQDSKPLFVNGKKLGEDYGDGTEGLKSSDNVDE